MTSEPAVPGAPAVILYRQVDRDDNGRTTHEDNYVRVKILTEAGRKYADVEIPFYKNTVEISNLRARSIAPDGTISEFEGKAFEKTIVKARGQQYLAKIFTLPNVQKGSILEYYFTYDFKEQYLFDSHWILSQELFTKDAKFSLKSYVPHNGGVSLRWTWRDLPEGTKAPAEGANHTVYLEAYSIPAFHAEDFMPPADELKARVDFIYSFELPERDQARFWAKVGKKRYEQLESFVGKRGEMESAVSQIVSPTDDPEVKLRKIYARVQQFRNTHYEVSKTEQQEKRDNPKAINNVGDIWKYGYANGMQLTWLYLALVRAAGFESYGVWVSERMRYFFDPNQMDASRLDANAVLVKLNGKDIYCDPGAAFAPFGLLPWYETGVQGLRLDKDGGTWIRTPLPDSATSRIVRKAELKVNDEGDLEGKLTVTYSGLEAMTKRVSQRLGDEEQRRKFLEEHVKQYISVAAEVELQGQPDWSSSSPDLTAEFKIKIPGWMTSAGKRTLLPVGIFSASEKGMFERSDRVHPVYFDYPFQKIDDIWIEFPENWKIGDLPAQQNNRGASVAYSLEVAQEKSKLHITRSLEVDVLSIPLDQYASLRAFFQFVRTGDDAQVMLQPQVATASN